MFHCNLMLPGKNMREYRYTKVSLQKYVGSTLCPAVRVSYTQLKQETSSSLAGAYLLFHRLAGMKSISSDISRAESVMFRAINLRRLSVEESGTSQVQNTENGKKQRFRESYSKQALQRDCSQSTKCLGVEREIALSENPQKILCVSVCLRISMKPFLVSFYLKCLSHSSDRKTSDTETNSNGLGLRSKPSKLFSSLNS